MAEYYGLGDVKKLLLKIGLTVSAYHIPRNFPPDWNYCPCAVEKICIKREKIVCNAPIIVGMYAPPSIASRKIPVVLEIIYERATRKGYIRANSAMLNSFLDSMKMNTLEKVKMPF